MTRNENFYYCSDWYFKEVRDYVENGLPEDHWYREIHDDDSEKDDDDTEKDDDDTEKDDDDTEKDSKLWNDSCNYQNFPKEIRVAARFRDGLVSDIYTEFYSDFCNGIWAKEYKKHSTIVFDYILENEEKEYFNENLCLKDEDIFT